MKSAYAELLAGDEAHLKSVPYQPKTLIEREER